MTGASPALGHHPRGGPFAWVHAFTGFYPAQVPTVSPGADGPASSEAGPGSQVQEFGDLDPITRFLYASRSVILVISAQAAVIAGLLAATERRFEVTPFVLVLLGFVVLHAISNLSNDYFGYRRGHDTADSPRRRYTLHPIASGAVTPRLLVGGLAVLAAVAIGIGAYFVVLRAWPALVLALVGAVLLYAYDAAPRALKELGLGEVAAFLVWGPLMIGGGYYVITGQWSWQVLLASVPYGLGVASILIGKHIDQRGFDTSQHQRTLPVVLGEGGARLLNRAVVAAMYVVTAAAIAVGALSPIAALVVLAAPRALHALRVMAAPAPSKPPPGYVGWPLWYHRVCLVHNRLFGWLFIVGIAAGAFVPGIRAFH